ncbi:hypothetical protein [Mycolicibacterium hodleri]|uniref:Uncharacterized protein n=1 Tax=Mycolicibacterium hodleri TaxID=49897 RepID=A0A502EG32_9MYCO|nr:hypothetical protein [Mycolicibacterium hodleri]TPG36648.1 hypothetical protein EAH80_01465 [Mycolicibacterium hodleri]
MRGPPQAAAWLGHWLAAELPPAVLYGYALTAMAFPLHPLHRSPGDDAVSATPPPLSPIDQTGRLLGAQHADQFLVRALQETFG